MESYFANFIKTGDPNGKELPKWPANNANGILNYINIDVTTKAQPANDRPRYVYFQFLESNR